MTALWRFASVLCSLRTVLQRISAKTPFESPSRRGLHQALSTVVAPRSSRAASRLWLLGATALCTACASATPIVADAPAQGMVEVANTTDRCYDAGQGHDLIISVDGARVGRVVAGAVKRLAVTVGRHTVSVQRPAGVASHWGSAETALPVVAAVDVTPPRLAWGCGAVETLGPSPLRLVVRPHRCAAGRLESTHWMMAGHSLARQAPGTSLTITVPPGRHRVDAVVARVAVQQHQVTTGAEVNPAPQVVSGCDSRGPITVRGRGRLLPLTVWYAPHKLCKTSLETRLAGKRLALAPGTGYTVYVPPGRHLLRFGDGTSQAVILKTAGSVVRRAQCIQSVAAGGEAPGVAERPSDLPPQPGLGGRVKPGKKP